ncbi:MAG: DUF2911 domain-containing protein [Acidobacteria bacterium]|nr:DUF2911 domain-containing protein [Acidobacteriota bacterium]
MTGLLVGALAACGQSPTTTEAKSYGGGTVSIKYAAPRVNGRAGKIFSKDGLISRDRTYPVWRAGANSATALHTEVDLNLGGLMVPKGDYTLFVELSDPAQWQLIVSKQTGQWGLSYNAANDVGRVKMTMSKPAELVENLKYTLTGEGKKGALQLEWENVRASVPLEAK